jgi:hypothetical protein
METPVKGGVAFAMQALQPSEMQAVCGGVGVLTDISGMPDRTVTCGTMWLLDRLLERFHPSPR